MEIRAPTAGPFFCPQGPGEAILHEKNGPPELPGRPFTRAGNRLVHVNYPIADAANNEHGGNGP